MDYDDEIANLRKEEVSWDRVRMEKDLDDGVWRERKAQDEDGNRDGYSELTLRPSGDYYDSDFSSPANPDDQTAGWLAYHEGEPRDETKPDAWLDGFDLAASSGREPYAIAQERMRLQELRDELGPVEDFLADVQNRLNMLEASQAALAREMGLPKQNISRWMTGVVEPSLESMLAIRDALETLEAA